MNRAYAVLTVKAVDEEQRIIRGVATTPEPDRMGDVVEPLGVKFKNPMPLLHQHDSTLPVGTVKFEKPTKNGITFEARLPVINEPGTLKDRVDTAWGEVKAGLVRAVSIGFRALEYAFIEGTNGIRFIESEVLELSLVSIPANSGALITEIKSIDTTIRAASGIKDDEGRPVPSGKSGSRKSPNQSPKEGKKMKTISERVAALESSRGAKAAEMEDIMTKATDAGRTLDSDEQETFDTLNGEVKALDADISRFRSLEKAQARKAKPVIDVDDENDGTEIRKGFEIVRQPKLEKGIRFARFARCAALSRGSMSDAALIAKHFYPSDEVLERVIKTAVPGANTTQTNWAAPLVPSEVTAVAADFVEYLRPATILGKFGQGGIPSLTNIPFRTPLITESSIGTAAWAGEGAGIKLTKGGFTRTTLDPLKLGAITVLTMELLNNSSPSADTLIRQQLVKAIVARLDGDFIDPAVAASSGVSPASVTHGVSTNHSSGNAADDVRADIQTLLTIFIGNDNLLNSGVWIMPSTIAMKLSLMRNAMGQKEFPDIDMRGGNLEGLPVIASEYVPTVTAGSYVILANAEDIYLGDEGGVEVDASREASLEMTDAPAQEVNTPTASATNMVSLWQTDSVGLRVKRTINWAKRRSASVQVLDQVQWGDAT